MQQRSGMAGNPFGAAFGGNPNGGTANPYNGNGMGMSPMSYAQFLFRQNPMGLPSTSQGRYAQRRRLIERDGNRMRVRKCVLELGKEVCIEYDDMNGLCTVDVMMGDRGEDEEVIGYYMFMNLFLCSIWMERYSVDFMMATVFV